MYGLKVSTFLVPTKVYLGVSSHKELNEAIADWGVKRILFLCDPGVATTEVFNMVEDILGEERVTFEVFTDIEPDPSDTTVEKAYDMYQHIQASALVALGGGSTIDVGKAVGILATNGGRIHDYEGIDKVATPPLPLIAIPTTAGTGSEVSGSCVITDTERGLKMSIRSVDLVPAKVALLDPVVLRFLPATVAAHSAMDAFVHAFESYISLDASPITDAVNLHAIELIAQNVRPFVSNRSNLDAGLKMLCAASLAGMSFSRTGLGNVHCMARFVGALLHISHGLSNAICLPHAAEFNLMANPEKYRRVAMAMGENTNGLTTLEAARKAIEAIKQLCQDLNIPQKLSDIGCTEDKIPEMAELAFAANYNRWNPRHTTYEDFFALFKRAL